MNDDENVSQDDLEFGGIFDLSADDVEAPSIGSGGSTADPDYYRPNINHKNAKDKTYVALGRFVPNVFDRGLQVVSKYVYYLPDPKNPQYNWYTDCPSNGGNGNNIISTAYFMLKDSDDFQLRKIAKDNFQRKQYFWRLFQIYQDQQETDLVGTIKIIRYGKQIEEKIAIQLKEDASIGKKACVVTDPFVGKDFVLNIAEVYDSESKRNITSYAKSYFQDERSTVSLDGGKTRVEKGEDGMKLIFAHLKANSPELAKEAYKPWDAEEEQKVIETVKSLVEDDKLFNAIYKKAYGKDYFGSTHESGSTTSSEDEQIPTIKLDETKATETKKETAPAKEEVKKEVVEAKEESSDAMAELKEKVEVKEEVAKETKAEEAKVEVAAEGEDSMNLDNLEINFDDIP